MKITLLLLLILLWSLVEVHSQTEFPYVSFRGEILPNHSYVDLNLVGRPGAGGDDVQCHTDLQRCCTTAEGPGPPSGYWYFPNGTRLPFSTNFVSVFESRGAQQIALRRNPVITPTSGIYRCVIPTNAVHDHDHNDPTVGETVYIGLYATEGNHALLMHK